MSHGEWNRDSATGLPDRVFAAIADGYKDADGNLRKDVIEQKDARGRVVGRLDLFDIRSFTAAAGYSSPYDFETRILERRFSTGPNSGSLIFHAVSLKNNHGVTVVRATCASSAQAGGEMARADGLMTRRETLVQFRKDMSSGSVD